MPRIIRPAENPQRYWDLAEADHKEIHRQGNFERQIVNLEASNHLNIVNHKGIVGSIMNNRFPLGNLFKK